MRTLSCALLVAALAAVPAAAQAPAAAKHDDHHDVRPAVTQDEIVLQGDTHPRPALPTINGDTGLWFVPTAETMPGGQVVVQRVPRELRPAAGPHRRQPDRFHRRRRHRRSLRAVRLVADWCASIATCRPTFIPGDPVFGGVSQEYPVPATRAGRRPSAGPSIVGAKWSLISQSRGDAMSLAPRFMVKFPSGYTWASTNDWDGHLDLVASREFGQRFELTGMAGAVLRGDPDEFRVSDGVTWGLGAHVPEPVAVPRAGRMARRVRHQGQHAGASMPPYVAEDGSIAPLAQPDLRPDELQGRRRLAGDQAACSCTWAATTASAPRAASSAGSTSTTTRGASTSASAGIRA